MKMTVREFIDNNPNVEIEDNEVMEGFYGDGWCSVEDALDEDILEVSSNPDGSVLIII